MMADGVGRGSNLVPVDGPGLPWPIAGLIGVLVAVVIGVVVGLPAVRIRGVQLAVVTIAAAVAIQSLYLENEVITQLRAGVPAFVKEPTFFGFDISARSERQQNENPAFVIFGGILLALLGIAVANLRRTGVGRRFLAVRDNEMAAAAAGINVARTKLLAFAISSGIAGIGGVMLGFKQVEVSSANFIYGFSLSVLAFAYLAGITSINGAMVAGVLLSAGALVPTTSNYFFAGTNIDNYLLPLGGLGIIVTAIIHPEGIAPFFGDGVRHAGNWLVSAMPGAESIRSNYRSAARVVVKVVLAAAVIGFAFLVYNVKFSDLFEVQIAISVLIVLLVLLVFAFVLASGQISPTFGEAGSQWVDWAKRFGPTALVGYVLGWIIWPLRVDEYERFWMPLLGAGLALFVRSLYRQIRYGHDGPDAVEAEPDDLDQLPAHDAGPTPEMI